MINLNKTHQFSDIIHETILYSGLEGAIISTSIFNRLHHILQSSLVGLTYSSNKVKRFEHSLGVMHLAGEILYQSFNNTDDTKLVNDILCECDDAIREWAKKIDFMAEGFSVDFIDKYNEHNINTVPIPKSNLYFEKLPHIVNEKYKFAYFVLFEATRVAGLLHDVGHLPYSHIFEYAINNLYNRVKNIKNRSTIQDDFLDIVKPYCEPIGESDKKEFHEEIGLKLVSQIKREIMNDLGSSKESLFVLIVLSFATEILKSKDCDNTIFSDVHKIVAGVVDADRLDYCTRDLYCSGVNKNIFPYKRFLSNYKLMRMKQIIDDGDRKRVLFCPAIKNIDEIEDLLNRRWQIFTKINYHHRVHKHETIFSEILEEIGFSELKNEKELGAIKYGKPLPLKLLGIWQLVKELKSDNSLINYYIIQIDDGWMDTLLRNTFFAKYKENYRDFNIKKDALWNKFDEIISAKKHYYTAFKRNTELIKLDDLIGQKWLKYIEGKETNETINKVSTCINSNISNEFYSFNLRKVLGILNNNYYADFFCDVEKSINILLKNDLGCTNISNCIIRPCKINTGFSESAPIYFWKTVNGRNECVRFEKVSNERKMLMVNNNYNAPFHLYYLPKDVSADIKLDVFEEILSDLIVEKLYKLAVEM